jgi:hypothetical protein
VGENPIKLTRLARKRAYFLVKTRTCSPFAGKKKPGLNMIENVLKIHEQKQEI